MVILVYLTVQYLKTIKNTCVSAPDTPQNVIAGYLNRNEFGVSWDRVGGADSFIVYIGETPNFDINESVVQAKTINLRANIANLVDGRTYYIVVSAINDCGTSSLSSSITYIFVES
tara:strand:+ start:22882 stop:23229 length:348 start_codon:yes stop_codon:yes gene_type:complete